MIWGLFNEKCMTTGANRTHILFGWHSDNSFTAGNSRIYREGPPLKRGRWKGSFPGRSGKEGELTCLDDVVQQHLESLLRLESCKGHLSLYVFVAIQLLNHIWLFATLWTATLQASLSFIISQSLLKYISIESVFPSIAQSPAPGKHWSTVGLCDLPV